MKLKQLKQKLDIVGEVTVKPIIYAYMIILAVMFFKIIMVLVEVAPSEEEFVWPWMIAILLCVIAIFITNILIGVWIELIDIHRELKNANTKKSKGKA